MPSRVAPRLLTRPELRLYLAGITVAELDQRMASGLIPRPVWGLAPTDPHARWDRRAVDRALDAASQIPASIEQEIDMLDRALGTHR